MNQAAALTRIGENPGSDGWRPAVALPFVVLDMAKRLCRCDLSLTYRWPHSACASLPWPKSGAGADVGLATSSPRLLV